MKLIKPFAVIGAAAACAWLASRRGPWAALGIFAAFMAALCGAVAWVVHRQPPEKVTFANYVMGVVLPWGYRVGRGKLPAIALTSWCIWMLLGVATVVAVERRGRAAAESTVAAADRNAPRSKTVMTLLVLAWVVDGAVLLRCIGILATTANAGHTARTMAPLMLFLVAILAGSVALVTLSHSAAAARRALLLAGGPPLLVVTAGRNARWN